MVSIKIFHFNPLCAACILIWGEEKKCMVVDPSCYTGEEKETLIQYIRSNGLTPVMTVLTHAHFDHILGVGSLLSEYDVPVYMNPRDKDVLRNSREMGRKFNLTDFPCDFTTTDIRQGDVLDLEGHSFEVIETPGHTPGGICLLCRSEKLLISGDTLFRGTIGRSDLYLGDYDDLITSVKDKLMVLDGDIDVIPGHGPCTSITEERTHNPMILPFNEPFEEDGKEDL